jgi:hypothetical protein
LCQRLAGQRTPTSSQPNSSVKNRSNFEPVLAREAEQLLIVVAVKKGPRAAR